MRPLIVLLCASCVCSGQALIKSGRLASAGFGGIQQIKPTISGQPVAVTCITNTTTDFTVTASGSPTLAYRWTTNTVPVSDSAAGYSGANSSTLWVSNVVMAQSNYAVACVVTNPYGSVTSSVATLTVTNGSSGANVTENFDEFANGAALDSSTNWSNFYENDYGVVYKPASDGALYGNGSGHEFLDIYVGAAFSANHRAEFTLKTVNASTAQYLGVLVRASDSLHCYNLVIQANGGALYLQVTNNVTLQSDVSTTWSAGNKFSLEVSGTGSATRLKVQVNTSGTWVNKWTDIDPGASNYFNTGAPGVTGYDGATTFTIDNVVMKDL